MRVERLNGYISLYRDLGSPEEEAENEEDEEADSVYHSASCQESEDERLSRNGSTLGRRSSSSPLSGLDEADDEVDQGIDVRRNATSLRPPPILVTESSTEEERTTRVRETLTIERKSKKATE